jgi:hypothetical protein
MHEAGAANDNKASLATLKNGLIKRNLTSNVRGVPLLLHGEVSLSLVELHEVPRALGPGRDGRVLRIVRQHLCTDTAKQRQIGTGRGMRKDYRKVSRREAYYSVIFH